MKSASRKVSIILLSHNPKLGTIGSIAQVKPGYMRNYLYPRKLAVYATLPNIQNIAVKKHSISQ